MTMGAVGITGTIPGAILGATLGAVARDRAGSAGEAISAAVATEDFSDGPATELVTQVSVEGYGGLRGAEVAST